MSGDAMPSFFTHDELHDTCRWLADAHAADDREQAITALCRLYRLLAAQGWTPSERSARLLRVQSAAVDASLARLVGRYWDADQQEEIE